MSPTFKFCSWLRGYIDGVGEQPSVEQWTNVATKLQEVLDSETLKAASIQSGLGGLIRNGDCGVQARL